MRPKITSLLLIATLATAALFFKLGSVRLDFLDESIYAESAKEMVQTGDWLTPHWNGVAFFQKPPILMWLTALLFKGFGISETAARTVAALSGVGAVITTLLLARRYFDEIPAVVATLALLFSAPFFTFARSAMMDVLLTFFILLAVYAYLRTKENARWWLLVGTSCGLAVMTKGAATAPFLISLLAASIWDRTNLTREVWAALLLFLVIGGTWHFVMFDLYGQAFLADYFGLHVLARATSGVDEQAKGFFYYLPVVGLFLPLLPFGLYRLWKQRDLPVIIPLFGLMTILFFSTAATKHAWYIVPALPFLSILIAPARGSVFTLRIYVLMLLLSVVATAINLKQNKANTAAYASVADLSLRAKLDSGAIGVFPEIDIGPEVLFYSDRHLCVDRDTQHTMAPMAQCSTPPEHIILPAQDLEQLRVRYDLTQLATSGAFVYCRADPLSSRSRDSVLREELHCEGPSRRCVLTRRKSGSAAREVNLRCINCINVRHIPAKIPAKQIMPS
ncbi:MAG TPA: glycosyltransferase family 39 protein [Pyrinomonadaceae bacterium]